jgi:hypothetical protein
MAYMAKPRVQRAPGRPLTDAVRLDCVRIGDLIASGHSEAEIRAELGLSRRAFDDRMRRLVRLTVSRPLIWAKYLAAQRADTRVLSEIADAALAADPPQLNAAINAIVARFKLSVATLEMGQRLGVYGDRGGPDHDGRPNLLGIDASDQDPVYVRHLQSVAQEALRTPESSFVLRGQPHDS